MVATPSHPLAPLAPAPLPPVMDVDAVGAMLGCSGRHVYRMADAGKLPRPLRIGALVRWRRADIEAWIADGCKSCR